MRSKELNLNKYDDTDKIANKMFDYYDKVLEPWVDREVKVLELGVYKGDSLLLWSDYFSKGTIVGIDVKLAKNFIPGERVQVYEGSQGDTEFLSEVANKVAPEGFDIIIDDASHIGILTKKSFWHLFENHLKPGGLYAIEDWGTGYFNDFHDGKGYKGGNRLLSAALSPFIPIVNTKKRIPFKIPHHSHRYGMVGFIKELVDEQGASDLTKQTTTGEPKRSSKFDSMHISSKVVFIRKREVGSQG